MTTEERRDAGDEPEIDATDAEVEALVDDIETTRNEMTQTVEEIGDRLDPRNIVDDARETVRAATVGKVEEMASSANAMMEDAGSAVREAGSGIVETITSNPIPAAMAAIGIGWLAMRRQPASTDRSGRRALDRPGTLEQAQRRAGRMADQVGRAVGDTADEIGSLADQVPYQVQTTSRQLGDQAGRMFQQNPLAVGAIAVAVGTAVGLALPATSLERRAVAGPARNVLDKAGETATGALGQVEQTARDAEIQAREADTRSRAH